jgi:hypothetical protein
MRAWHAPPCVLLSHTHIAPRTWHCVTPWYVHAGARPGLCSSFRLLEGAGVSPHGGATPLLAHAEREQAQRKSNAAAPRANVCHVGYPAWNDGDTLRRTCSCSKNPPVPALSCNHRRRASRHLGNALDHDVAGTGLGHGLANFLRELLQGFSDVAVAVAVTDTRAVVRLRPRGMAREHPPQQGAQSSKHGQFSMAPPLLPLRPGATVDPNSSRWSGRRCRLA